MTSLSSKLAKAFLELSISDLSGVTMSDVEVVKRTEKIEKSPLYVPEGPLVGRPEIVDRAVCTLEMTKLIDGVKSAFYLAAQPLFRFDGSSFIKAQEELLLRCRNGSQQFPVVTTYNMTSELRVKFQKHQLEVAVARSKITGIPCSVNFWAQDLLVLSDEIIAICRGELVIIELTEYAKAGDDPGFPTHATFDERLPMVLTDLKKAGIKVSLDDISHVSQTLNYPMTFAFALEVLDVVSQIKFDIKMMAQIFEELPEVPFAEKFAPLERDAAVLGTKREDLSRFMRHVWERRHDVEVVLELSVITEEIANRFPELSPFNKDRQILVQGGSTNDWAEGVFL